MLFHRILYFGATVLVFYGKGQNLCQKLVLPRGIRCAVKWISKGIS